MWRKRSRPRPRTLLIAAVSSGAQARSKTRAVLAMWFERPGRAPAVTPAAAGGAAVDERILHLVRNDRDAAVDDRAQMGRIEVGESQVLDLASVDELGEEGEGVEIAGVVVVPPVELKEVDGLDVHAAEGAVDGGF